MSLLLSLLILVTGLGCTLTIGLLLLILDVRVVLRVLLCLRRLAFFGKMQWTGT